MFKTAFNQIFRLVRYFLMIAGIFLFLYIGLKSLIMCTWFPSKSETYLASSPDGNTTFEFTILPKDKSLLTYMNSDTNEIALAQTFWAPGTHYFGPIWKTEYGGFLGLFWINDRSRPIDLQIKIINKRILIGNQSVFPEIGSTQKLVVLKTDDHLIFNGTRFDKIPVAEDLIADAMKILSH